MKNAKQIRKEIESEIEFYKKDLTDTKERRASKKRVALLNSALLCAEKSPTEVFLREQLKKARGMLSAYNNLRQNIAHLSTQAEIKTYQSELKATYKPSQARRQVLFINYILSE